MDVSANLQKSTALKQIFLVLMELLHNAHWHIRTNLQKKHCIEQIFLVLMELLHNARHIRVMEFGDLPQIWK